MKRNHKILTVAVACMLLVASLVVTAIVAGAEDYTGNVATLSEKIAAVESASNAGKMDAFKTVASYVVTVDPKADGYAEAVAKLNTLRFDYAKTLLDAVDINLGTAKNGVLVGTVQRFVTDHPIDKATDGYAEFEATLEEKVVEQQEAMAALLLEYSKAAPLEDYNRSVSANNTFIGTAMGKVDTVANGSSVNYAGMADGRDGSNRYYRITYNEQKHTYVKFSNLMGSDGLVFELDYTVFDGFPNGIVELEHQSVEALDGSVKLYPKYLVFNSNGSIEIKGGNTVLAPGYVAEGVWTRISIVIDPNTAKFKVYINYEYMGEGKSAAKGYVPNDIRVGSAKSDNGASFAVDNILGYQGLALRDVNYLKNLSNEEKFIAHVEYIQKEDTAPLGIKNSYDAARELLGIFWIDNGTPEGSLLTDNPDVIQAVAEFRAFDYEAVLLVIKTEKLAELKPLAEGLAAIKPNLTNINDRTIALNEVDNFLTANAGMILEGDEYNSYMSIVSSFRTTIDSDKVALNFIGVVERFGRGLTVAAKQRYYETAKDYVLNQGLNLSVMENEGYESLKAAYEVYLTMPKQVEDAIKEDNSKKLVKSMSFIIDYDTEEKWWANYDYVEKYVLIVREIVKSGDYDAEYEGVEAALERFEPVNAFYYHQLQLEHVVNITAMLESFRNAGSYIERLGYLAKVDAYIANSDIDPNNADINDLKTTIASYKSELQLQEDDYSGVLRQNTVYFINAIEILRTCGDYTSKKAAYNAATEFYYAMNVGSDEAKAAIADYNKVGEELKTIEAATAAFIDGVALMDTSLTGAAAFVQLTALCELKENVNVAVEGATDALEAFGEAYDAYYSVVSTANEEAQATAVTALTERVGKVSTGFLSVIYELIFG